MLLSFAAFFAFQFSYKHASRVITFQQAKKEAFVWGMIAGQVDDVTLRRLIRQHPHSWLRAKLLLNPASDSTEIEAGKLVPIRQVIAEQRKPEISISFRLPSGKYLVLHGRQPAGKQVERQLAIISGVFFLLLVVFCYFIIQYMSVPLEPLKNAVERLAHDINAPAIEERGSQEMRAVIRAHNVMQTNLRQLLDDRTHMLTAISHDLRTPITRLKLRAESISDTQLYDKIIADLNDMELMIQSILTYGREQHSDESRQRFDIVALLSSICDDASDMGKNVELKTTLKQLPYTGRMMSLKRCFTNIIDNAVKYGNQCAIGIEKQDNHIELEFLDAGSGVDEDKLDAIFKPFYRTDPARSPGLPGTGLGLALVKQIITSEGGEVLASNRKSGGLMIKIVLPEN